MARTPGRCLNPSKGVYPRVTLNPIAPGVNLIERARNRPGVIQPTLGNDLKLNFSYYHLGEAARRIWKSKEFLHCTRTIYDREFTEIPSVSGVPECEHVSNISRISKRISCYTLDTTRWTYVHNCSRNTSRMTDRCKPGILKKKREREEYKYTGKW